jgi:hypothetical protein
MTASELSGLSRKRSRDCWSCDTINGVDFRVSSYLSFYGRFQRLCVGADLRSAIIDKCKG